MAAMVGPAPDGNGGSGHVPLPTMAPKDDDFVPELVPLDHPRPLSGNERVLIDVLLAGPLGRRELRQQAETARVVGVCSCGCSSVHLGVDPASPRAKFAAEEVPLGRTDAFLIAARQDRSRGSTDVILHVLDGRLSELEIWIGTFGVRARVDPSKLAYDDWSSPEGG
jgi:hypothetical protein